MSLAFDGEWFPLIFVVWQNVTMRLSARHHSSTWKPNRLRVQAIHGFFSWLGAELRDFHVSARWEQLRRKNGGRSCHCGRWPTGLVVMPTSALDEGWTRETSWTSTTAVIGWSPKLDRSDDRDYDRQRTWAIVPLRSFWNSTPSRTSNLHCGPSSKEDTSESVRACVRVNG